MFTSSEYNGTGPVALPLTSKMGGQFIIEGSDANGVSKIYLKDPNGEPTGKYECYPNPDVSGSNPGLNTRKNN